MNKFELFCMIFYVLDADWDDTKDAVVGEQLSGANPFLFDDSGSADPAVFAHFCTVIDRDITEKNSYSLAVKYIEELNDKNITKAFYSLGEETWMNSVSDYLSRKHKGGEQRIAR